MDSDQPDRQIEEKIRKKVNSEAPPAANNSDLEFFLMRNDISFEVREQAMTEALEMIDSDIDMTTRQELMKEIVANILANRRTTDLQELPTGSKSRVPMVSSLSLADVTLPDGSSSYSLEVIFSSSDVSLSDDVSLMGIYNAHFGTQSRTVRLGKQTKQKSQIYSVLIRIL